MAIHDEFSLLNFKKQYVQGKIRFCDGHGTTGIHNLLQEDYVFYMALIRNPLKQYISYLTSSRHMNPKNAGFGAGVMPKNCWLYEQYLPNALIHWYGDGDPGLAEARLFEQYLFFGITEQFAETISALGSVFPHLNEITSVTNVNMSQKSEEVVSDEAKEYFFDRNREDMDLYAKCVKEFQRRCSSGEYDASRKIEIITLERSFNRIEKKKQ